MADRLRLHQVPADSFEAAVPFDLVLRVDATWAFEALAAADEHRDLWLGGYHDVLGFVTLLLRPTER